MLKRAQTFVRRALPATLLLLFGGIVAVLLSELLLRATGLVPGRGGVFTVTDREFEQVPGIFLPGQDVLVQHKPMLPFRVRINSLGYRGADLPLAKPVGEFRILYLGDSFVFGDFVEDSETLPAQLQEKLAQRCVGTMVVVNAGVGGSTITEQSQMAARGLSINPDLVILQFHENDVDDLSPPSMWDRLAANRELKSRFPMSVVYPYVRRTALWSLATRAAANLQATSVASPSDSLLPVAERSPDNAETISAEARRREYERLLRTLRDDLDRQGVPFLMTVFPSYHSVYRDEPGSPLLQWLDEVMLKSGIPSVSFLAPLADDGRPVTELYLLPHDGHASASGYAVAARSLVNQLSSNGVLTGECQSH